MYWHIDTDIISLLVITALYVYSLQASKGKKRDLQTASFLLCLLVGMAVTVIDIASSIVMEVPVSRFVYHLFMTLDFLGLEITIVFWLRYSMTIIYHNDEKRRRRVTRALEISYLAYALFTILNPITGAIYSLGPNNEYQRGPLFFLMTAVYAIYAVVLFLLVLRRKNHLPKGYPAYPLLMTLVIVSVSIPAQLLMPGWLLILPGYMFSMLLAFLFLQTRRAKEQELSEQMGIIMNSVTGGICASSVDEAGKVRILMANETYYAMLGYTKEQFEAEMKSPTDPLLPEDRDRVMAIVAGVIAHRGKGDFEYRCSKRDGSICVVHCQNSVTDIAGLGNSVLLAVLTDVTRLKAAEEAALVHEAEMRLAMSQMGKLICEFSPETRTVTVPEIYSQNFEIPNEFVVVPDNENRKATIDPEYWQSYLDFHEAICRGEATGTVEIRTIWADGSRHWEHGAFYTIFDSSGKPVKAIIAVEDTTKQHNSYELEQSRPTLGEENLMIHTLSNLNTGETLDYARWDGGEAPVKQSISPSFDEHMINAQERERYLAMTDHQSLLEHFENGETELSMDYRLRLPEGDVIWARNILRMVREPGGSDVLLFEYCYNIEEEKTQELMYGALVNENFDFVGRVNARTGEYIIINGRSTGAAMPPLHGANLDDIIRDFAAPATHPDDRERLLTQVNIRNIIEKLKESNNFRFTSRLVLPDGQVLYKALNMYYLDRERQIIIITREDVSAAVWDEMRKNQQLSEALAAAEQANLAKSRFLSRMSHELRTPMNVILGTTELAGLDVHSTPTMKEACDTITSSANYLLTLINDILEISRIEGGRLALVQEPFRLSELLEDIEGLIRTQAKEKDITLEIKPWSGDDALVGDRSKLRQILMNLLSNAMNFTPPKGRVSLSAEQTGVRDGKALLRFTVADNGVGISKEFMPHMFELFSQESVGNTSTGTGTGLGLPIVKNLVELMNGQVDAFSVKGQGSEFTVRLELEIQENAPATQEPANQQTPDLTDRLILMAEDNSLNAFITENLLNKAGATVVVAANGQQAVEVFRDSPPGKFDGILMDIRMPVMDGLAATKSIRAMDKADSKTVPIIAVSANAFDEDVELSLQSGMNAHLAKPIDPQLLFSTLQHYISRREMGLYGSEEGKNNE